MDEKCIIVPSKCTKVVRNNNWSEREKEILTEHCTKNSSVFHETVNSSVLCSD